ncbi:MAG TPA: hypothetical protein VI548_11270 [Chitinophagaceae bacterium]|nr:hypothetical protein [Chitinophagaceae bacterium]
MKKSILVLMLIMSAGSMSVIAQGGGFQQRTPEERLKPVHLKIDSAFKLEADKMTKVDDIFLAAYKESDKMREEMINSGNQDFQAMREKMKPINDARDEKLKAVLGEANFKIWKEQIEPTIGRRGPGGGNRQ